MPTSTIAASTGAFGERRVGHRDDGLEERQRVSASWSASCGERRDVVVGLRNCSSVSGSPSTEIRSVIDSTCGLVNRPVRSPVARIRVSIIREVLVLPLVPVRWRTG